MFCSNCGEPVQGEFCVSCGFAIDFDGGRTGYSNQDSIVVPTKSKSNLILTIVSVVLALLIAGSTSVSISASSDVTNYELAISKSATELASLSIDLADYQDDVETSTQSRSDCYVNWYCSATTYRMWGTVVSGYEMLVTSTQLEITKVQTKKRLDESKLTSAESIRMAGIALSILLSLGLATTISLLVRSRLKQRLGKIL